MTGACIAHFAERATNVAAPAVVRARVRGAAARPARGAEKPRSEVARDVG
jgi:hypothetical protein